MHKALLLLKKIPKGKVTSYKELAKATKSSPRAIGQVMRTNPVPDGCPCYKVVKSTGEIGGYGGKTTGKKIREKIKLLEKDGIVIENGNTHMKKYLYKFSAG